MALDEEEEHDNGHKGNTGLPVYQVAEMLGYSSQFAFSVAYSRHVGCAPTGRNAVSAG